MPKGDAKLCEQVRRALADKNILEGELDEQHATKFTAKIGVDKAAIKVFHTGAIVVEGKESALKTWLLKLKESITTAGSAPGVLLPAEIERFPQTLLERVPACDDVVTWFFTEALKCYKAGSTAGAAFMLGASSEKLILLLIECYASRISDSSNREKFLSRVNNRMISVKFEEFKKSYRGSQSRPKDPLLALEPEHMLESTFNFYRSTRNQVGHPQVIPDLDKGVILANIGQFITYAERVYALIAFFESNDITV